jgi:hypothetical protein
MTIEDLKQILDYIQTYSASTWITVAAAAFGFVCLKVLYKAPSDDPKLRWPLFGSIVALLLLVAAQGLSWWSSNSLTSTPPEQAFRALQENKRVAWLIRLIPYSSRTEPYLSIHELKTLGPPKDKFVFVADYTELKNLPVSNAIYRLGLSLGNKDSVSAVIFPLDRRALYPANVRGLLQVIQLLDREMKDEPNYKAFEIANYVDKTALDQLDDKRLSSWSWKGYSEYFEQYSAAVAEARKSRASALQYIGTLGLDWHPTGYSQIIVQNSGNSEPAVKNFRLETQNKKEVKLDNFGARAFLLENLKLQDINHLILIHFTNLDADRIPELRGHLEEIGHAR